MVAADHALHLVCGVAYLIYLDLVCLENASTLQRRTVTVSYSFLTGLERLHNSLGLCAAGVTLMTGSMSALSGLGRHTLQHKTCFCGELMASATLCCKTQLVVQPSSPPAGSCCSALLPCTTHDMAVARHHWQDASLRMAANLQSTQLELLQQEGTQACPCTKCN